MTVRMTSCRDLSEDKEAVTRLAKYLRAIEENNTPVTILLPWFPSFAKKAKQKATMALYTTILSYITARRKSSALSNIDPIDLFISQGISDNTIVGVRPPCDISRYRLMLQQTVLGLIFAGVANTGVNCECSLL
jgi:hypothetical protein